MFESSFNKNNEREVKARQDDVFQEDGQAQRKYQSILYFLLGVLIVSVISVSVVVVLVQREQQEHVQHLIDSYERVETFDSVLTAMVDAETGERGFVITGEEVFLEPYHEALPRLESMLKRLQGYTRGEPELETTVAELEATAKRTLEEIKRVVAARREEGFEAARELVATRNVKHDMDRLRDLIADALLKERERLVTEATATRVAGRRAEWAMIGGVALGALVLLLALGLMRRESLRRIRLQRWLERSREELKEMVNRSDAQFAGRERLRKFSDQLHGCHEIEEATAVIARHLPRFAPTESGALCLLNRSKVYLETVQEWGMHPPSGGVFEPDNCLSLRRGRPYWRQHPADEIPCRHLTVDDETPTVCYPLSAHNESLGVLVLAGPAIAEIDAAGAELMEYVVETISVVLAHLQLQSALRRQAVQDPLTGLYNRRHMESSLEREVARARRTKTLLAVIMVDVDYFKQYNDTFGHDAADATLVGIAHVFSSQTRLEDIACRYGGEEFLMVMPGINRETATSRVEQMRESVESLRPQFRGRALGGVTISAGVAMFPDHGDSPESLVSAADAALYQAKHQGRNQVCVANDAEHSKSRENGSEEQGAEH